MAPDVRHEPLESWAELVRAAVDGEDTQRFVAAAAQALGGPVGLVSAAGRFRGHAPPGPEGRRALAVAAGAGMPPTAPPGWTVVPVLNAGAGTGVLAVGVSGAGGAGEPLLHLVATLLGEHLKRAVLLQAQVAGLVHRLVTDPAMGAQRARRDAAALGLTLAEAYWPAVLGPRAGRTPPSVMDRVHREARSLVSGGLTAAIGDRMVLLHPARNGAGDALSWFEQVVERMRVLAPGDGAQAIAAEGAVELGALSLEVTRLNHLRELESRAGEDRPVISAREYALDHLLEQIVATADAQRFVEDRLGTLIAWDREHGTDLLRVLEAALDHPRHDRAASGCYMHRNTFRHRLRLAMRVLGDGLEDPDARLAVHVALKLRRALGSAGRGG